MLDQKIPDSLIKIIFLEKVETAVRSDVRSRFVIRGFSTSDSMWGPWLSFQRDRVCVG